MQPISQITLGTISRNKFEIKVWWKKIWSLAQSLLRLKILFLVSGGGHWDGGSEYCNTTKNERNIAKNIHQNTP